MNAVPVPAAGHDVCGLLHGRIAGIRTVRLWTGCTATGLPGDVPGGRLHPPNAPSAVSKPTTRDIADNTDTTTSNTRRDEPRDTATSVNRKHLSRRHHAVTQWKLRGSSVEDHDHNAATRPNTIKPKRTRQRQPRTLRSARIQSTFGEAPVIDVEVLGPLVLRVEGRPVRLGPMLRTLLVALLCADGRTLGSAVLERRLWENPPPGAADTVRSHVSHVRSAVCRATEPPDGRRGQRLLVTEKAPGGTRYSLHMDPQRVDVARFELLIRAGRAALRRDRFEQAATHLRSALGLWRGRPLEDVAHLPFARAPIAHLENLHTTAVLGRIEADIWSGHHREVIGELEILRARQPDDGAVPQLLATSLYLSERLAEAAFVCQQSIVGLQAHGLDPGPMTELQHHVLNRTLPRRGPLAA
jgi:DNA-binding SARP family transcriptional activator